MKTLNAYLNFNGNCEKAFDFYKSVFGGEYTYREKFKSMPPMPGQPPLSEEEGEKIMHVSLPISKETILMGSDMGGDWVSSFVAGNNFAMSLATDSKEEADRLFEGLSHEGTVIMPMADMFWGDYYGMFTDKFGIRWMISYNKNAPQVEKA